MIDYAHPANFALDDLWFSYRGELFKGQGFMEWNPTEGFRINALLDKNFAPIDLFKTLGQTILNDKIDTFSIWLRIKGLGSAIAPGVFPLAQKRSIITTLSNQMTVHGSARKAWAAFCANICRKNGLWRVTGRCKRMCA